MEYMMINFECVALENGKCDVKFYLNGKSDVKFSKVPR
jgi:hypothetical protein